DPKKPNATNFNRTNYDVFDIAANESKAIAFARRIHRQDPTQIIYLEPHGFRPESFACHLDGDTHCPPVNLMIEAIDDIKGKVEILELAARQKIPIIQLADVGSKVQLNFNSPSDNETGKSVMFGVSKQKLRSLMNSDFTNAAAAFVGLDNAAFDEIGRFYLGKKNTPFGAVTPQLGSTAMAAAALATEKALRYLLDKQHSPRFPYRRLIIDKKNNFFKTQNYRRPLAIVLDYLFQLKSRLPAPS
ncbi:MAG: hypothetical protein LBD63_02275, partial [Mycoplasmataceae bacterium]|nr:hypothetical protein [Mycoplasmataceae bacterium]